MLKLLKRLPCKSQLFFSTEDDHEFLLRFVEENIIKYHHTIVSTVLSHGRKKSLKEIRMENDMDAE